MWEEEQCRQWNLCGFGRAEETLVECRRTCRQWNLCGFGAAEETLV
jgi:hypothetical protein